MSVLVNTWLKVNIISYSRINKEGAHGTPTVGSSPEGLPAEMYIFEKDKKPRPKKWKK